MHITPSFGPVLHTATLSSGPSYTRYQPQPTYHNRQTSRLTTYKTKTYTSCCAYLDHRQLLYKTKTCASCCANKTYNSCCAVKTKTIASCRASQDQEGVQGREEKRKTATSAQLPVLSVLP